MVKTLIVQTVSNGSNEDRFLLNDSFDLLEGLGHAVGFDMGVPVLLPAVALPTHLALERFQAHVFVHVLLEILCFIETLITAGGHRRQENQILLIL